MGRALLENLIVFQLQKEIFGILWNARACNYIHVCAIVPYQEPNKFAPHHCLSKGA